MRKKRGNYSVQRNLKSSVEPEEILLDANLLKQNAPDDEHLERSKYELPIHSRKISILAYVALLIFVVFLGKIYFLQKNQGARFEKMVQSQSARIEYAPAVRGIVYDEAMTPLISNIESFDLAWMPGQKTLSPEQMEQAKNMISKAVLLSSEELLQLDRAIMGGGKTPVIIKEHLSNEEIIFFKTNQETVPEVKLVSRTGRKYVSGEPLAHILGYVGRASEPEMEADPSLVFSDILGKSGVEQYYDAVLRGQRGFIRQQVNAKGELQPFREVSAPVNGKNIVLTVHRELQESAYRLIKEAADRAGTGMAASLVALDPNNGNIIAMASYPSYDNNIFSTRTNTSEIQNLFVDKKKPSLNRAIAGRYPPGSTIKPLISIAALEEGVVTEHTIIDDTRGALVIQNVYNPQKPFTFNDWKAHGFINLRRAIAESCDVYFYIVGGGFGSIRGLGIETMDRYLGYFGLGTKTGIDIFGENAGLLPTVEWKQKTFGQDWFIGDTYHASIGQGDVLATPLQIASAISAVANGGTLYAPRIASKIVDEAGNMVNTVDKKVTRKISSSEKNMTVVREGMRQAVTAGSARALASLPFAVAGKTGTAQFANNTKTHAWFVAFAPYENPTIALAVLIEGGGEGSTTAIPVAGNFLKAFFEQEKDQI
jgi:penicillin-binding protein 2